MSAEGVVFCPGCGIPRESLHSAAQHGWKTQDDDHAHMADLDDAIIAVVDHHTGGGGDTAPDGDSSTVPDGPEPSNANGAEPSETASDGAGSGLGLEPVEPEQPDPDPAEAVEEDEEGDELPCPHCGDDLGADPEDVEASVRYRCTACGDRFYGSEVTA